MQTTINIPFSGIIPPLVTPLLDNDTPRYRAIASRGI